MQFIPAFFNQAIMMSGTDLSMFGMGRPFYRPRIYAQKLAKAVGCNAEESYSMIRCLRNNASITWEMIVEAQHRIEPNVCQSYVYCYFLFHGTKLANFEFKEF